MAITIKEIQVKTTVENTSKQDFLPEDLLKKLKDSILQEIESKKLSYSKYRKER